MLAGLIRSFADGILRIMPATAAVVSNYVGDLEEIADMAKWKIGGTMKIKNVYDPDDTVSVEESERNGKMHVYLKIGEGKPSRHANLRPHKAKAIAYALLSYSEQISN